MEKSNEMKSLVTGATGFVGQNLVSELLKKGYTVSVLIRSKKKLEPLADEVEIIEGDVTDLKNVNPKIFRGVDVVFHIAGLISGFREEQYMKVNFLGTKNLVQMIIDSGYKPKFVYTSSLAAVGPGKDINSVITEDDPPHPVDFYGKSKRKAEEFLILMRNSINSVILRPTAIYGYLDKALLSLFDISAKLAFPVIKDSVISVIHASDVVKAHILAAENETKSAEIFNISDGQRYTMEEIFSIINQISLEQFSRRLRKLVIPREVILYISYIMRLVPPRLGENLKMISPDTILRLCQKNWFCTYEKAEKYLGFRPSYTAREGLKQSLLWYMKKSTFA